MRLSLVVSLVSLSVALGATPLHAQSSCAGFQSVCAKRCAERAPDDRNCVSDHCTPKLGECRSTGCWQEGRLYGGKLSCNLRKS